MEVKQIFNIQVQKEEILLLLFLVLNMLVIIKCLYELSKMGEKCTSLESCINNNTMRNKSFMDVLHSTLLHPYIVQFEKEKIAYQIDIQKNIDKKLETILNSNEKEAILFILTQLFQTAFELIKKSNVKQVYFQVTLSSSCIVFTLQHFIPSKKTYIKTTYGKKKERKKIQAILNKHKTMQLSADIVENFICHKIQIYKKSQKRNQKSFSSHKE